MATSTPSRRRNDPVQPLEWVLYRVSVLDFRTDYRSVCPRGYIGISDRVDGQPRTAAGHRVHADVPFARFLEHLTQRKFGDLIVGVPEVLSRHSTEADALKAELEAIGTQLPQYNITGNPDHPDRVTPWAQDEMRAARDEARRSGRQIHDLGHSRYATTPRTRPDQIRAAGATNGYSHGVVTDVPAPPAAPRPAGGARPRPARRTGKVTPRRVVLAFGVALGLWAAAAAVAAAAGVPLPFEVAAPFAAMTGTGFALWRTPTT